MFQNHHFGRRTVALLALVALALVPLAGSGAALAAPLGQQPRPTDPVPDPHQNGVVWFAATGHTLRGSFLTYWNAHGGLAQFGYPITEEFVEPGGPTANLPPTVQYFERNRFEHHPEFAGTPSEVLLGLLGRDFHPPDPPVPAKADPATMYFRQTGHNLSGLFRRYWQDHGALPINGYPISESFNEVNPIDGQTYQVQYFERARYEYHPEHAGTPYEVLLGLLGTQLARQKGYFGPPAQTYPLQGHAADYSWIAGRVVHTTIQGGCVFVHYDGNNNVQPIGPGWAAAQNTPAGAAGANVVLFGHLAGPGEPVPVCPAKAYVVDRVQLNTAPAP